MTMEWLQENWPYIFSALFGAIVCATGIVETIAARTRGKGDDKWAKRLRWLHDKLSPYALRNQEKLHQPSPPPTPMPPADEK